MSFINHFRELENGRTDINIRHDLLDVVFLAITAMLSGARGWKGIQLFGEAKLDWLRQHRRFEAGVPRRHTIARIISAIRPESLLECFVGWVNEARGVSGKGQIAIDGKTLRRIHPGDKG